MQQAEEADAETEAERRRGFRLIAEGGVIELQLLQRLSQLGKIVTVDRVQPCEDHGVRLPVAGQHFRRRAAGQGDGVTDARLADVLHAGDQVAHFADREPLSLHRLRRDHPDLEHLVGGVGGHHQDAIAVLDRSVDNPDVGDHAAVGVVDRVEDQGPGRPSRFADRGGYLRNDLVEQRRHAVAGLGADPQHFICVTADDGRQLARELVRLGTWQVNLVQHRDDDEVGLKRQIEIGQGLGLDSLRGVHQ